MLNPHQLKLMEVAPTMGVQIEDLSKNWAMDIVAYHYEGKTVRIIEGQTFPSLSERARELIDHKIACKEILKELRIPTAPAIFIGDIQQCSDEISAFIQAHKPVVCKPLLGMDGRGVLLDVTSLEDVARHLDSMPDEPFMLEKQLVGSDLRLQAVNGKLVAACTRIPTTLEGDGYSTVAQLIEARRREMASEQGFGEIEINQETRTLLDQRGLTLGSILNQGQTVQIKKAANVSQGARAIDLTDEVHSDYHRCMEQVAEALDITIFAMDFIVTDHRGPIQENAMVLEINARPAWGLHHHSQGRKHNIAGHIFRELFNLA